jgi:hypothetical protein
VYTICNFENVVTVTTNVCYFNLKLLEKASKTFELFIWRTFLVCLIIDLFLFEVIG